MSKPRRKFILRQLNDRIEYFRNKSKQAIQDINPGLAKQYNQMIQDKQYLIRLVKSQMPPIVDRCIAMTIKGHRCTRSWGYRCGKLCLQHWQQKH